MQNRNVNLSSANSILLPNTQIPDVNEPATFHVNLSSKAKPQKKRKQPEPASHPISRQIPGYLNSISLRKIYQTCIAEKTVAAKLNVDPHTLRQHLITLYGIRFSELKKLSEVEFEQRFKSVANLIGAEIKIRKEEDASFNQDLTSKFKTCKFKLFEFSLREIYFACYNQSRSLAAKFLNAHDTTLDKHLKKMYASSISELRNILPDAFEVKYGQVADVKFPKPVKILKKQQKINTYLFNLTLRKIYDHIHHAANPIIVTRDFEITPTILEKYLNEIYHLSILDLQNMPLKLFNTTYREIAHLTGTDVKLNTNNRTNLTSTSSLIDDTNDDSIAINHHVDESNFLLAETTNNSVDINSQIEVTDFNNALTENLPDFEEIPILNALPTSPLQNFSFFANNNSQEDLTSCPSPELSSSLWLELHTENEDTMLANITAYKKI